MHTDNFEPELLSTFTNLYSGGGVKSPAGKFFEIYHRKVNVLLKENITFGTAKSYFPPPAVDFRKKSFVFSV